MANKLYEESSIQAIANAIRDKNGSSAKLKPRDMADAIRAISTGGIYGVDIRWQQTQPNVMSFIAAARAAYTPSNYGNSIIGQYVGNVPQYAKAINGTISTPSGVIKIVDANTGIVTEKTVIAGANTIRNISPSDSGSHYVVENSDGDIIQAGKVIPTGFPRVIHANAQNVRDLGGWPCDSGTIKYGMLFRGGEIGASEIPFLVDECGIRAELNLRGQEEAQRTESPLGEDVAYCCPKDFVWYTIEAYTKESWKEILRFVFDNIRNGRPIYFHCSAGADRTGTVACILESILGVSQVDIDIDYEITNFEYGVEGASARVRNGGNWLGLIGQITAKTGSTFRDKVINWVATLGFTADEINAFRRAMINGTPQEIVLDIGENTITKNLTNATADDTATTAVAYQPYTTNIKAADGYVIDSVVVTMGGNVITTGVWKGQKTTLNVAVSNILTNCSTDNSKVAIIAGQSYGARITPISGYTLNGAEISITMGGVDVSTYYSDGSIVIPNVTGDIVITVNAVPSALPYTNQVPISTDASGNIFNGIGYKNGYRLNSSHLEKELVNAVLTGFIPCKAGDTIYLSGACGINMPSEASHNNGFYDTAKNYLSATHDPPMAFHYANPETYQNALNAVSPYEWDSVNKVLHSFTVPNNPNIAYMRLTLDGTDGADAIVTVNEPIE